MRGPVQKCTFFACSRHLRCAQANRIRKINQVSLGYIVSSPATLRDYVRLGPLQKMMVGVEHRKEPGVTPPELFSRFKDSDMTRNDLGCPVEAT
jgi:hypothetical protein